MTNFSDVKIGSIAETPITLEDLIFELKTDLNQKVVGHMIDTALLRRYAGELGVSVSDEELQQAANNFRVDEGLLSAKETNEWLDESGLTVEEFEKKIENDLLRVKVQQVLATEDKRMKIFAENILQYEMAKIAEIVVRDKGLAEEIKTQLDEGDAEFSELASKYSLDKESAEKGGFVGFVNRYDLPDELSVAVFADDAAGIIGPIETGKGYYIVKIVEPKKSDPEDEKTKEMIVKSIFEDYFAEKAQTIGLKLDFIKS